MSSMWKERADGSKISMVGARCCWKVIPSEKAHLDYVVNIVKKAAGNKRHRHDNQPPKSSRIWKHQNDNVFRHRKQLTKGSLNTEDCSPFPFRHTFLHNLSYGQVSHPEAEASKR